MRRPTDLSGLGLVLSEMFGGAIDVPTRPNPNRERAKLEHSLETVRAHASATCEAPCSIHHRTDHSMRSFPQHWRDDRRIMERICSHGVGHPDPDCKRIRDGADDGDHGCDGCCRP